MSETVVITGLGIVSPLGTGVDVFWKAALEGRSGVRRLQGPWIDDTGLATRIAAPVAGFDPDAAGLPARLRRLMDPVSLYAVAAAGQAVAAAGLEPAPRDGARDGLSLAQVAPERLAVAVGSGIGGLGTIETSHGAWREKASKDAVKRYSLPMLIPNAPAGQVAIRFGAQAECRALSTACAAGTMAIGDAFRLLRAGEADVALAGGTEGVVTDEDAYGLMGFDRLRTLSTRNEAPEAASRPFDLDRDGFVLGEGAAILVLEREAHARARGARPLARVLGYASNCDAHSMMQPDESGNRIHDLMVAALAAARMAPEDVDVISAHGTSTPAGDRTEARALRRVFGSHADSMPVTALKSMTGHGIAASGPMECVATVLALEHGVIPPTLNLEHQDPDCPILVVAPRAEARACRTAVKLSYGFGGHNAALVLARP